MIPIYDLSSFENACKSLAHKSLLTCWLVTCLKQSIICLIVVISNDYVRAFRQSVFYKVYLNGGRCGEGHGKDELKLQTTIKPIWWPFANGQRHY